jgi:hypothetical protein
MIITARSVIDQREISAMFNIGPFELLFLLPMIVLFLWPAWRICAKAGFPGALGLLIVVPLLNLFLLYFLAFVEWPSLRRQKEYSRLDV